MKAKWFIDAVELEDERGDPYPGVRVTEKAWRWIEANEGKFTFHSSSGKKAEDEFDDTIPF